MAQVVTRLHLATHPALLLFDGKVPPGQFPLDHFFLIIV
jgi:hypothetical protein